MPPLLLLMMPLLLLLIMMPLLLLLIMMHLLLLLLRMHLLLPHPKRDYHAMYHRAWSECGDRSRWFATKGREKIRV